MYILKYFISVGKMEYSDLELIGTSMVNMHNNYRLHLLLLWRRKNKDQRASVDIHCGILSDIDDKSLDMDTCVSMQQ